MRNRLLLLSIAIFAITLAGTFALAQDLPKLPADIALKQSPGSPGQVTFLHISHLGEKPDCTRCHPKLFGIVKHGGTAPADRTITHARMEKGRQCGACHNGKAAFGFDDCTSCHHSGTRP